MIRKRSTTRRRKRVNAGMEASKLAEHPTPAEQSDLDETDTIVELLPNDPLPRNGAGHVSKLSVADDSLINDALSNDLPNNNLPIDDISSNILPDNAVIEKLVNGDKRDVLSVDLSGDLQQTVSSSAISAPIISTPTKGESSEVSVGQRDVNEVDTDRGDQVTRVETANRADLQQTSEVEDKRDGDDVDVIDRVDAVVDRRSPDSEHPQPMNPMDAVAQVVGQSTLDEMAQASPDKKDVQATISHTQVQAPDPQLDSQPDQTVTIEAITVDIQTSEDDASDPSDSSETKHSNADVNHSHYSNDHTNVDVDDLRQNLAIAQAQVIELNQQVTQLQDELERSQTQVVQLTSQLKRQKDHQDNSQRETQKLTENVTTLQKELEEAKRYILQLTSSTSSNSPSSNLPSSNLPSIPSRSSSQRSHQTNSQHRPLSSPIPRTKSLSPRPTGLPPMSTERLGGQQIAASSVRLRPAYTRPGFSNASAPPQPTGSKRPQNAAMPPLESLSRETNAGEIKPPTTKPSSQGTSNSSIVRQRRAPIVPRRSRYDELKPELTSSELPKPKVSDTEIGWFD